MSGPKRAISNRTISTATVIWKRYAGFLEEITEAGTKNLAANFGFSDEFQG
jgi:hypothetical protein